MLTAFESLERLKSGNERFATNVRSLDAMLSHARRPDFTDGQNPFAIILGCSDSRVPAEVVFDQGLGDLFVIRVAGNIVAPSQVGSVEFAAARYHSRLVVVMGHSRCGAIQATVESICSPELDGDSRNIASIVDRVRPSVLSVATPELREHPAEWIKRATRANVRASVDHLRHGSAVLEQLIERDGLLVVGAEYSLETGRVEFFDGAL
ncbi:MAG: carbonic anhydrase [Planctomycetota bacterium]